MNTTYPAAKKVNSQSDGTPSGLLLHLIIRAPDGDHLTMLTNVRKGLTFNSIVMLAKALDVPIKEMAALLSISATTLARRKKDRQLKADESDRVVRLARLKDAAVDMMGDDRKAIEWLKTPSVILLGECPLVHANTEIGARAVEDMIVRIQHGVCN